MQKAENPITNIMNEGWENRLQNQNKDIINMIAKKNLPFLTRLAKNLQIETDTNYSIEELVNLGYIGLVAIITEQGLAKFDAEDMKLQVEDFLTKLIMSEDKEIDSLETYDCLAENCFGKDCTRKKCYAFTSDAELINQMATREDLFDLEFKPKRKAKVLKLKK